MPSLGRGELGALTALTMGVATFPVVVFSVLASDLILDFGVERWQVGALVTATGVVGGLVSPAFGRVTDHMGAARSTLGVLALGALVIGSISLSPSFGLLFAAAVLNGVPQGWANPATNTLIIENVPPGSRGVVTGIKQSGVQMGTFLGGALLPIFAGWWDWRLAILAFLVFPLAGVAVMVQRGAAGRIASTARMRGGVIPVSVRWISVYGALSGLAVSATFTFLPLFAQEDQGWSARAAGWLIAGVGVIGIVARIVWGHLAERRLGHGRTLRILAFTATVAALVLAAAAAGVIPSQALVLTTILFGAGPIAWNAVGMLAVMDLSPRESAGRGTGIVLLGFLLGIGTGAPLMGLSVDRLGTYLPGWLTVATLFFLGALVAGRIRAPDTLAPI